MLPRISFALLAIAMVASAAVTGGAPARSPWFAIQVIDQETGRGVPLAELETVNRIVHVSDSAGLIAFQEPGLMDREVYFHVRSHGYDYPPDALGNRGVKLTPLAGERATVRLRRLNVAERLYRVTGGGIYRDSLLLGETVPLRQPLINGQVLGQDTVIVTPYRGQLYWFWGDTDQVAYPLGNFAAAGATSELPDRGGLPPAVGVDLTYFTGANGFARAMCPDFGPGLHWIEAVFTLPDETGTERLVARVSSQRGLLPAYAWHFAVFNDEKGGFESKVRWDSGETHDSAHPFRARVEGVDYLYLYPNYRVRADWRSAADPTRYEAFTFVGGDGKLRGADTPVDRDPGTGALRYTWKAGADRLQEGRLKTLVDAKRLQAADSWLRVTDVATGQTVAGGRGSVFWNAHRHRWVRIMAGGQAGNVWYAEADTPTGPWGFARRIVAHDHYNFYNVTQHPFFDEEGGRLIYFEGTYTESFSGAKTRTARYDYNQVMYRLRLDDPRLALPEPIYRVSEGARWRWLTATDVNASRARDRLQTVAWHAFPPDRGPAGTLAIFQDITGRLSATAIQASPLFRGLPLPAPRTNGLNGRWQWHAKGAGDGEIAFALDLEEQNGRVTAVGHETSARGQGTLQDGALALTLELEGETYLLGARFADEQLRGEWRRSDGRDAGTWRAEPVDLTPAEFRTPAVVPLYEYRSSADGGWFYSTDPDVTMSGWVREPQPLCRVWQAPAPLEAADVSLFGQPHNSD